MENSVVFDVFPAEVLVTKPGDSTEIVTSVRVFIFNPDRLEIYADSSAPDPPHLKLSGIITEQTGNRDDGLRLTVQDGTVYFVKRAGGCGCGSRLRGFRPYDPMSYAIQYR